MKDVSGMQDHMYDAIVIVIPLVLESDVSEIGSIDLMWNISLTYRQIYEPRKETSESSLEGNLSIIWFTSQEMKN